jgi:hypothetical protein
LLAGFLVQKLQTSNFKRQGSTQTQIPKTAVEGAGMEGWQRPGEGRLNQRGAGVWDFTCPD